MYFIWQPPTTPPPPTAPNSCSPTLTNKQTCFFSLTSIVHSLNHTIQKTRPVPRKISSHHNACSWLLRVRDKSIIHSITDCIRMIAFYPLLCLDYAQREINPSFIVSMIVFGWLPFILYYTIYTLSVSLLSIYK